MGFALIKKDDLASADLPSLQIERYSTERLRSVKKLVITNQNTFTRIHERLATFLEKRQAVGAALYVSSTRDTLVEKVGKFDEELAARINKERLFSGEVIDGSTFFIQPVEQENHVIGYLAVQKSEEGAGIMPDIIAAYADMLSYELELGAKISALEQRAEKMEKKEEELQKAQEYNNNLLSITSHDLSSPINAVSGYLDLMEESFENDLSLDQIACYHKRIQSGVQDVKDMLRQLSDISKIERGTISLEMVKVNMGWLVQKVADILESKALEKNIEFSVETSGSPAYVKADTVKLKRVAQNLIGNAIKYTEQGGRVEVEVGQDDDMVFMKVRDNGIGIAESHYSKIFAPFVKIEKSDDYNSNGLGLYVASYFTDLMNGEIEVESKENEGSIFTVSLPRAEI